MSDPNQPTTPPGWYPDGQGGQRWWDGRQWTEHTQPGDAGGQRPTPATPQTPSAGYDAPTQVAPNRAADYPPQQGQPAQPQPQQPYGAPAQQPYGAPAQQPYGAQPGYGAPQYGTPTRSGGKKGLLIGIIVAVVLVLLVCGIGGFFLLKGGGGPKGVADDYLGALADGDFNKACELSSGDAQKKIFDESGATKCSDVEDKYDEQLAAAGQDGSFKDFFKDLDVNYDLGAVNENGDKATVKYTIEVKYTGDDETIGQAFEQPKSDETLTLVKESGDWKVDSDSGDM